MLQNTNHGVSIPYVVVVLIFTTFITLNDDTTFYIGVATADRMIRFIFNDGYEATPITHCSDADNQLIDSIFGNDAVISGNIRNRERQQKQDNIFPLRGSTTTRNKISSISTANKLPKHTSTSHHWQRSLNRGYCKNNCDGYAAGTCRATGCIVSRRNVREIDRRRNNYYISLEEHHRELQLSCTNAVQTISEQLDNLITNNQISFSCQEFIAQYSRSISYYDDSIYGEILGVRVWDTESGIVVISSMPFNGYEICSNQTFTMTSINHACVDMVKFNLHGPNGYNYVHEEDAEPYSLFLVDDNGILTGKQLDVGAYNLSVTPDNDETKSKEFQFLIVDCVKTRKQQKKKKKTANKTTLRLYY